MCLRELCMAYSDWKGMLNESEIFPAPGSDGNLLKESGEQ
jgi:hypothetical protein